MIHAIIAFSIRNKLIVMLGVLALIGWGIYAFSQLPLDAVPDITNNQVQVVTSSPSLAPQEMEQFITQPIERAMANLQGVEEIRSISRYGLSVITIVFDDGMPTLEARQLVGEKLQTIGNEIPSELGQPEMMPITTGLGEIYQYTLNVKPGYEDKFDLATLRTIQDWIIKRQLAGLKGIVEVSSFGGYVKEYEVTLAPDKLAAQDVTVQEVMDALAVNNQNVGGSYIEKNSNSLFVRAEGMMKTLDDIGQTTIKTQDGVPVLVRDVASNIGFGHAKRFGAMTRDGKGETVGGITLMLKGANAAEVVTAVKERMLKISTSLPEGIEITPFLDRASLVNRAIKTVRNNLLEGGLIVIFVLVILLGNWRAGIIVASVIPLSMLFALGMMHVFGVSANLMSLGALDFGLIVDGAVVIVEGIIHQLHVRYSGVKLKQNEMDGTVETFASKVMNSAAFGQIIILIVYLPILALVGVEGKMFKPMAMTVSFAIIGALILSLTYVPMVSSLVLSKNIKAHQGFADKLMQKIARWYAPILKWALRKGGRIILAGALLLAGCIALFTQLGSVFIPTLEEGDLAIQMSVPPGTSLEQVTELTTQTEKTLIQHFPEILHVVSKTGTSEVPTDPMGIEDSDIMVVLKEKSEWITAPNREKLVDSMKAVLGTIPGVSYEFSQPIQLRFNELMTGSKADLAIKIYGDDLDVLFEKGQAVKQLIHEIPGASDIKVEQINGLPQLIVSYDRARMAQYGLSIETVNNAIRAGFAGMPVGVIYEGERRFDMVVRFEENSRENLDVFQTMYVRTPTGAMVPISQVATIKQEIGPMLISRDNAQRRIVIGVNVRNRDIASLVSEIDQTLKQKLPLPDGYYITYGGEFEKLNHAKARLSVAVPVALLLIIALLYFAFRSLSEAILIFSAVPMSAIGGILALYARDMPFSISAGVGFIALFGVAVLNGIVLIGYFNQLKAEGRQSIIRIVMEGTLVRLRPVLMTAAVASLGFLPMAVSTSAGGEVQQPLATVVIGGLVSSTLLTLLVLPILYTLWNTRKHKRNMINKGTLAILLAGSFWHFGAAQSTPTTPYRLEQLDSLTLVFNDEYVNSVWDVKKASTQQKTAWDVGLTDFTWTRGQINAALTDNHFNIQQDLGNPIQSIWSSQHLKAIVNSYKVQAENKRNSLLYSVAILYNQWQKAYALRSLLYTEVQRATRFAEITALQYQKGEASYLWMQAAQLHQDEQILRLQALHTEVNMWMYQLQQHTGLKDAIRPVDTTLQVLSIANTSQTFDFAQHPEWKLQSALLTQAQKQLAYQKAGFSPRMFAGYFNQELEHVTDYQGAYIGISFPLWFLNQQAAIEAARIDVKKQTYTQTFLQHKLTKEFEMLQEQLSLSSQRLAYFTEKALPHALEITTQADLLFNSGEISYYEYLQLFEQALRIKENYIEEVHQFNQLVLTHKWIRAQF